MRADSALSHLYEDELCVATLKDGSKCQLRWDRQRWQFVYADTEPPIACRFEDIVAWRPESIRF
jgi:hypothetical protein